MEVLRERNLNTNELNKHKSFINLFIIEWLAFIRADKWSIWFSSHLKSSHESTPTESKSFKTKVPFESHYVFIPICIYDEFLFPLNIVAVFLSDQNFHFWIYVSWPAAYFFVMYVRSILLGCYLRPASCPLDDKTWKQRVGFPAQITRECSTDFALVIDWNELVTTHNNL